MPSENLDENSLEGCLSHAAKIESLIDKNNLYLCEQCTEDHYGKSKFLDYYFSESKKKHRT